MTRYFEIIDAQGEKKYCFGGGLKQFANKALINANSKTRVTNIDNAIKELSSLGYKVKEY